MNLLPALVLGILPTTGAAPVNVTCNADLVCMKTYKNPHVSMVLESYTHKPLSVQVYFTTQNLRHLQPAVVRFDQPAVLEVASFQQPLGPWGYEYRTHYGHTARPHDDTHVYELPYAPGTAYRVAQSHDALSTHRLGNRYAIDWAMPIGEPVFAARGGTVVSTYAESDGPRTGNHIWIQHSDGTIGKYLHLAHRGVHVEEGDAVTAGALIARSGDTGFSRGPHLHFSVSSLGGRYLYQTFNVTFRTLRGNRKLQGGEVYQRPPIPAPRR